jgi:hypothetical protein
MISSSHRAVSFLDSTSESDIVWLNIFSPEYTYIAGVCVRDLSVETFAGTGYDNDEGHGQGGKKRRGRERR